MTTTRISMYYTETQNRVCSATTTDDAMYHSTTEKNRTDIRNDTHFASYDKSMGVALFATIGAASDIVGDLCRQLP